MKQRLLITYDPKKHRVSVIGNINVYGMVMIEDMIVDHNNELFRKIIKRGGATMNTETGELRRFASNPGQIEGLRGDVESIREGFTMVPEELEEEAAQLLGDSASVMVDMSSKTPLVKWAKKQSKNNRKAMQKASKKRNR